MSKLKSPVAIILFAGFLFLCFFSCEKSANTARNDNGNNNDVAVTYDIQYGSNKDISGKLLNLKLDVYTPSGTTPGQKLPFILFVHGGGFTAGDKSSATNAMISFAEAGFVGASIDYRINTTLDPSGDPCTIDTSISNKTIYMAAQDTKAAMRFMVANAEKYNIDTSRLFFVGSSAGAVAVMNAYYLPQEDFNRHMPNVERALGGLDNADNNLTNTFRVLAIGSNSACLPSVEYINAENVVPAIFFHGGADSVIPVEKGHSYYCPNTAYVYGSISLYKRYQQLDEPAVLHIYPGGEHGPYTQDFLTQNEICFFNSVLNRKVETGSYSGETSSCP